MHENSARIDFVAIPCTLKRAKPGLLPCRKRPAFLNDVSRHMTTNRVAQEKATVELMLRLYCRRKEGNDTLCPACNELLDYALNRLDRCRFGPNKPTCRKCPVHCYSNEMRERIRTVMRWAGPRMMVYHPVAAVRHLLRER